MKKNIILILKEELGHENYEIVEQEGEIYTIKERVEK